MHLSKSILLPLIGGTVFEDMGFLDELPHGGWTVAVSLVELPGNVGIALPGFGQLKQRLAILGERLRAAGVITNAVDVVGILLLVPVLDGVAFHGEKRRDRGDCDLDAVLAAGGHRAVDRHHLVKVQREIGTIRALDGEIVDEGRACSS